MRPTIIRVARSSEDFSAFASLIGEYVDWSKDRWSDFGTAVDDFFDKQSLNDELASLSTAYTTPNGLALLAFEGEVAIGCAALRRLDERICEMKRVFVPPRNQRTATGRRLCQELISQAKSQSFSVMLLDTDTRSFEAIGLYESLGFVHCKPYIEYPPQFAPYMIFMELSLRSA